MIIGRNAFGYFAVACGAWVVACAGNAVKPAAPASASPGPEAQGVAVDGEVPVDRLLSPEPALTARAEPAPLAPALASESSARASGPVLSGVHSSPSGGRSSESAPSPDRRSGPVASLPVATVGQGIPRGLTRGKGDAADRELALGGAATARSDYSGALQHYRKARRLIPKAAGPLVGISIARLGLLGIPTEFAGAPKDRRLQGPKRLLGDALKLEPDFGPAHLQLGRILLIEGDAKGSAQSLGRAVQLLPDDAEAHSALAVASLAQGDVAAAVSGFERAASLAPNEAERLTNLGTAYMMQGDAQRAISAYRQAVSLAPNEARALGDLGTALLATNNISGALPHLERAHALAPERATFMSNLGYAMQQKGDLPAAVRWYEKALEKDAKLGSAWINLGVVRAKQGDFDAAEKALKRAQSLDASDPRVKANLEELEQARAGRAP